MKRPRKFSFSKSIKTRLIVSITVIVLLLLSFFFADSIEKALGLNRTLFKNETTSDKISASAYEVCYLDVGQGNSTYIRLPDGKNVLIDGGSEAYGETVVKFLKNKSVARIDYMIATHADSDHVGGLSIVLDEFEVKHILRPFQIAGTGTTAATFVPFEYEYLASVYEFYQTETNGRSKINRVTSDDYKNFIQKAYTETYTEIGISVSSEVTVFYDGLKFSGENYFIEFFAPFVRDDAVPFDPQILKTNGYATAGYGASESNGNSAIFLLSCDNDKYLFTGDAPYKNGSSNPSSSERFEELDFVRSLSETEREMLENVTVYLAGHHGSGHSSSAELLELINPRFVVISVGEFNNYGHPASDVIYRIEKTRKIEIDYLLRTDHNGNVTFIKTDDVKYVVERKPNGRTSFVSWELFATVICVNLLILINSIKWKTPENERFFQ